MSYFEKLQALQSQREAAMRQGKQDVDEVAGSAYQRKVEQYNDKLESLKKPYETFRTTMEDVAGISGGLSAVGKAVKKFREARAGPEEAPKEEDVNSPPDTVTQETSISSEGGSRPVTQSDPSAPLSDEQTGASAEADSSSVDASTSTEASVVRPSAQAAEATESSAFDVGTTIPRNTNASVLSDYKAAGDEPFSEPRTLTREIGVNNNVSTDLHTNPSAADVQDSGASSSDISSASDAATGASEAAEGAAEEGASAASGALATAAEVGSTVLDAIPVVGEIAMVGSLLAALFSGKKEASATAKVQKPPSPVAPQIVQAGFDAQQAK